MDIHNYTYATVLMSSLEDANDSETSFACQTLEKDPVPIFLINR